MVKHATKELRLNMRLADEDRMMLSALASDDGLPESAVIRLLVRREYRARGLGAPASAAGPAPKPTKARR